MSLASVVLVVGAAAIVALALYRLLSHTSGLDLRAGWATVGIAFGAACAFMFVAPGVGRIGMRRWRWLRARDDASRAHTAWREFRDDLQDLGVGCAPSEPPRTLAGRVSAGLPEPAREAVRRIALAEEQRQLRGAAVPVGAPEAGRRRRPARHRGVGAARQPLAGQDLPGLGDDGGGRRGGPDPRSPGGPGLAPMDRAQASKLTLGGADPFRSEVRVRLVGRGADATSGGRLPAGGATAPPCAPSAGPASPGRDPDLGRTRPPPAAGWPWRVRAGPGPRAAAS